MLWMHQFIVIFFLKQKIWRNFSKIELKSHRPKLDKKSITLLKVIAWEVITINLQCQGGLNPPERFLQSKPNTTCYKQHLHTKNEQFCCFESISVHSITLFLNTDRPHSELIIKHWAWSLLRCEDFIALCIILYNAR